MLRLGVVIGDNANFFKDVLHVFQEYYQITGFSYREISFPVMATRINRFLRLQNWYQFCDQQDVLFFEWASDKLVMASHARKSCPVIVRLLGYELFHWAPYINWDYVDIIIVLLDEVKRQFAERYPEQEHKCVVIPHGIDLSQYDPNPLPYRGHVGVLGFITPRKRVYELILAVSDVITSGLDLHLFVAGEPDKKYERDYVPIRRLPAKLNISDRIHMEGYVPNTAAWLKNIDIFISNSYTETQHVALQEAMASGCYCLAHFWDGVEEFMPAENIFGTNGELVKKIATFVSMDASTRVAKQLEMVRIVRRFFDHKRTTKQLLEIIQGVSDA